MTRTEAMRAATRGYATTAATAGADVELARVVEWLRDMPLAQLGPLIGLSDLSDLTGGSDEAEFRTFLRAVARLAEAHAHWPKESGDA